MKNKKIIAIAISNLFIGLSQSVYASDTGFLEQVKINALPKHQYFSGNSLNKIDSNTSLPLKNLTISDESVPPVIVVDGTVKVIEQTVEAVMGSENETIKSAQVIVADENTEVVKQSRKKLANKKSKAPAEASIKFVDNKSQLESNQKISVAENKTMELIPYVESIDHQNTSSINYKKFEIKNDEVKGDLEVIDVQKVTYDNVNISFNSVNDVPTPQLNIADFGIKNPVTQDSIFVKNHSIKIPLFIARNLNEKNKQFTLIKKHTENGGKILIKGTSGSIYEVNRIKNANSRVEDVKNNLISKGINPDAIRTYQLESYKDSKDKAGVALAFYKE